MNAIPLGLELPLDTLPRVVSRAATGAVDLPVDNETRLRFRALCAPFPDDKGHVWWTGAIDSGADGSGGYGRFQGGAGKDGVICIAHRMAWTLENGPVPEGLVVRHRCDEPLCVAVGHLELGTPADNRWDALDRPFRPADLDTRGSAGRSRAIRAAVRDVLALGVVDSARLGVAVREAMSLGDPNRFQLTLFADETASPADTATNEDSDRSSSQLVLLPTF